MKIYVIYPEGARNERRKTSRRWKALAYFAVMGALEWCRAACRDFEPPSRPILVEVHIGRRIKRPSYGVL